jgi:hypothetical protein
MRRVAESGRFALHEARWVYASALLREARRDPAAGEAGRRLVAELAAQFPDNPVFRRALEAGTAEPQ